MLIYNGVSIDNAFYNGSTVGIYNGVKIWPNEPAPAASAVLNWSSVGLPLIWYWVSGDRRSQYRSTSASCILFDFNKDDPNELFTVDYRELGYDNNQSLYVGTYYTTRTKQFRFAQPTQLVPDVFTNFTVSSFDISVSASQNTNYTHTLKFNNNALSGINLVLPPNTTVTASAHSTARFDANSITNMTVEDKIGYLSDFDFVIPEARATFNVSVTANFMQ